MKKILKNYLFPIIVLVSIIIGTLIGVYAPNFAKEIKPFGDIFLNLMFTIVVPLVFVTIASSIANMVDLRRLGKIMSRMFAVFFVTCVISAIVMLIATIICNPANGTNISTEAGEVVEASNIGEKIVAALTVTDFSELLSRSNMLPLIIFTILFGIGISSLGEKGKKLAEMLNIASQAMMKVVKFVMYYAPIGLCAYFASLVSIFGAALLEGYIKAFVLYTVICVIYFLIFYTIYAYVAGGTKGIKMFYKNVLSPTATALATQSSLASLPSNLEATKNIGLREDVREVCLPIGTTMNMHGSVMGAILKIAFLFTVFGESFSGIGTFTTAVLIAVLSGMVMSGIPGGGLIGEMLIVSLYSFPAGAFAIIATIGIVIDAPATAVNVVGNTSSAMLINRLIEGKNWIKPIK